MILNAKQMYSYIKSRGFIQSKDVLGTYFDKGDHKLTINKQADWYTCFHNVKQGTGWQLVAKSTIFDNYQLALSWVVKEIEKI